MSLLNILSQVLFAVLMILALILILKTKPWVKRENYPEGHWIGVGIGIGMGIGMPIGLAIGVALKNVPIGVAIGPALGAGIGIGMGGMLEKRHRTADESLNEDAQEIQKWFKKAAVFILLLAIIILGALVVLRGQSF